jgi:hypothetical protein
MKTNQKLISSIIGIFIGIFELSLSTAGFAEQHQPRLNLIVGINIKGKSRVEILRNLGKKIQPAYIGDYLDSDDKLRVSKGASGEIACDNGKTWILSPGEFRVADRCEYTDKPIYKRRGSITSPTRSDNKNANIPYLMNPRNTAIMTSKPTLRWHPIAGVTSYSLQILSGGDVIWETQVSQPMVVYAGAPLKSCNVKSCTVYDVVISTGGGISTKNTDEPKFLLLDDDKIALIKADIKNIQNQSLNTEAKSLALAHLYRSNDLNDMATDELERLVKNGSKITAVYQLLGDIYQQIGLNSLAKARYEIGLTLARKEGNSGAQESIQVGIAEVNKALD